MVVDEAVFAGDEAPTTFSLPQVTPPPTLSPTRPPTTSRPTSVDCEIISIIIVADANTGGADGKVVVWELFERDSGSMIASGDPLGPSENFAESFCVDPGMEYIFSITDSDYLWFGEECEDCRFGIIIGGLDGDDYVTIANTAFLFTMLWSSLACPLACPQRVMIRISMELIRTSMELIRISMDFHAAWISDSPFKLTPGRTKRRGKS